MQSVSPSWRKLTNTGANGLNKAATLGILLAVAALAAGAAYAGADTTFSPALTKFTVALDPVLVVP